MLDKNLQSPLHVSSYFGDFKASRVLTARGAEPASAAYAVRPLEVGKDKFTRSVLQNLNKAATEANTNASYNGHSKIVNFLLKWEADGDVLQEMRTSQNKIAFNMSKDKDTKKAFTHVWRACKEGELDLVRCLVREGQDPNE
jgi:ankyrin repeat protein